MNATDCNILFDFNEIYNQSASYAPRGDGEIKLTNGVHITKHSDETYCNLDDFPFLRDKMYSKSTSEPKRLSPISRAYEEAYLVEGIGKEGCVRGNRCECVHMFGFTLRKFEFPGVDFGGRCVLCIRVETLGLYLDARTNGITPQRAIQPYRNIVGVKSEYSMKDCISSEGQEIEPYVLHVRSKYEETRANGTRRVVQSGYGDFRISPSRKQ